MCKSKSVSAMKAAREYQNPEKISRYVSRLRGSRTDRLETMCLKAAIDFLYMPGEISVLDIPCGTGRIGKLLKQNGYRVTGADISSLMVELARDAGYDMLKVADVFETGFSDKEFDLVICHRLLQYFNEAEDRRNALCELCRISKGPVIVSFSCLWALDHLWYKVRRLLGIKRKRSCVPIGWLDFLSDAHAANLDVIKWIAARPLISKRWYAIMRPLRKANFD